MDLYINDEKVQDIEKFASNKKTNIYHFKIEVEKNSEMDIFFKKALEAKSYKFNNINIKEYINEN